MKCESVKHLHGQSSRYSFGGCEHEAEHYVIVLGIPPHRVYRLCTECKNRHAAGNTLLYVLTEEEMIIKDIIE